jgi:hypothetical protein
MTPPPRLQLKVTLDHIKPPIWRRLVVAEDTTLAALHDIVQAAMGWRSYHLHAFMIRGQRFGPPSRDDFVPVVDERKHRIGALISRKGERFAYEYDFGDGWKHTIVVEELGEAVAGETVPACLIGRRACPPEDCGGPYGYADFVEAVADPKHERHDELLDWVGGQFDPDFFELDDVNDTLAKIARPRRAHGRGLH